MAGVALVGTGVTAVLVGVVLSMLRALAGRLRELADLAGDLSLRDVVSRMAGALLRLAGRRSVVELPARSELAAVVGSVREVGTRALRELEASGAIHLDRR